MAAVFQSCAGQNKQIHFSQSSQYDTIFYKIPRLILEDKKIINILDTLNERQKINLNRKEILPFFGLIDSQDPSVGFEFRFGLTNNYELAFVPELPPFIDSVTGVFEYNKLVFFVRLDQVYLGEKKIFQLTQDSVRVSFLKLRTSKHNYLPSFFSIYRHYYYNMDQFCFNREHVVRFP